MSEENRGQIHEGSDGSKGVLDGLPDPLRELTLRFIASPEDASLPRRELLAYGNEIDTAVVIARLVELVGEDSITTYRRLSASSAAVRWERDLYRAALDAIVSGDGDPLVRARSAIAADNARREANLAAMQAGLPLPQLIGPATSPVTETDR